MKRSDSANQQGVALVMFAMLLIAIIGGVALGIDVFIAASSKAQHHHTAEQAVLAAMDAYISFSDNPAATDAVNNDNRLQAAATRASQVVLANKDRWLGSLFFTDGTLTQSDVGRYSSPGVNGQLNPGNWHFEDPGCGTYTQSGISPSCPCVAGSWAGDACFEPLLNTEKGNALKIVLRLNSGAPIRTLFAPVIGTDYVTFGSDATVAEIPRRGVFLIDMSLSIIDDTHVENSDFPTRRFLYTHEPVSGDCSTMVGAQTSWPASWFIGPTSQSAWSDTLAIGAPSLLNENEHCAVDYACVDGDQSFGDGRDVPDYVLEPTKRPEPLSSIIDAVQAGLLAFQSRAVPSDRVGIVAFDDETIFSRASITTSPAVGYALLEPTTTDLQFRRWLKATDTAEADTRIRLDTIDGAGAFATDGEIDLFLLPRAIGGETPSYFYYYDLGGTAGAYDVGIDTPLGTYTQGNTPVTDLFAGLNRALEMLDTGTSLKNAENFVVLFSDGKTICRENPVYATTVDFTSTTPTLFADVSSRCFGSQNFFDDSMSRIANLMDDFEDNNVKFHMVIAGDSVQPHTLLYAGADGCLSDSQVRNWPGDPDFVNTIDSAYTNPSNYSDPIFYGPNRLWEFVKQTSGRWIPIRTSCDSDELIDISSGLDQACQDYVSGGGSAGDLLPQGAIQTGGASPHIVLSDLEQADISGIVDTNSRLICDPQGRSVAEQMQAAVNNIMGTTPFVLVEEKP